MVTKRKKRGGAWKAGLVVVALVTGGIFVANREEAPQGPPCTVTMEGQTVSLTAEQAKHATTIAAVASRLAMPNRAVTVAYATVFQESGMVNLDYGDRDSIGLFQQRPSQGWGTVDQIMDPNYSATQFFVKLADVRGWADMSINDAAQTVQRSGFPEAYGQWEFQARLMARALTGEMPATFRCRANVQRNADAAAAAAPQFRMEAGIPDIGTEVSEGRGWMTASWLIANAEQYGVESVAFNGQLWTSENTEWQSIATNDMVVRVNY